MGFNSGFKGLNISKVSKGNASPDFISGVSWYESNISAESIVICDLQFLVLYNINERNVFRYLLTDKPKVFSLIVLEITSDVYLNKNTKKRDNFWFYYICLPYQINLVKFSFRIVLSLKLVVNFVTSSELNIFRKCSNTDGASPKIRFV